MTRDHSIPIFALLWLIAVGAAFALDQRVALVSEWRAVDKNHIGNHILKIGGDFRFTLAVALAFIMWHPRGWRVAGHLALAGITGGALYSFCKWATGRRRPVVDINPFEFDPFISGWKGLFDEGNLSFPSGHATLAFATAAVLAIAIPRKKYFFYALAAVVGVERIAENAHYLSDVVAGAGVGIFSAYLIAWISQAIGSRKQGGFPVMLDRPILAGLSAGANMSANVSSASSRVESVRT